MAGEGYDGNMSARAGRIAVKICGVMTPEDAETAVAAGADLIGVLVDVPVSPRSLTLDKARTVGAGHPCVALTYNARLSLNRAASEEMAPSALQLAGAESPEAAAAVAAAVRCPVWKSIHISREAGEQHLQETLTLIGAFADSGVSTIILDTAVGSRRGGTGTPHDWSFAAAVARDSELPVFLAGGLTPANVSEAIRIVRPDGVDVSSGVESAPGVKDADDVRSFVSAVRRATAE